METKSINENGCSVCLAGQENYTQFIAGAFRGKIFFQYDYRTSDGALFSTIASTLEECRARRDEWLKTQNIMTPTLFSELEFQYVELTTEKGTIKGIYSESRLKMDSVPAGLYAYAVRHDEIWKPATIENNVTVDYFGVLLVNEPLDMADSTYLTILEWVYVDPDNCPDWARKYLVDTCNN